ncbi:MAG: O-antigen polymerase [Fusobacteriaceae bacterium]
MLIKIILILIVIYFCYKFSKKFFLVEIKDYFLFGFTMYFLVPLYFLKEKIIKDNIVIDKFYYLNEISNNKFNYFILYIVVIILACLLGLKNGNKKRTLKGTKISNLLLLSSFYFCTIILTLLYIFNYKTILNGYGDFNANFRSASISLLIVLQTLMIYILIKKNKIYTKETIVFFSLFFILVLSGSRLNFISAIISYSTYLLRFIKLKSKKVLGAGIVLFIFFGWITLKRLGVSNFKYIDLFKNNLYEFLYTGISEITFISKNDNFNLFELPLELIGDLKNFIPSFLRNSNSTYKSLYEYDSPLGAKNLIVSIIENFGLFGGIIFIYLFSYFLVRISNSKKLNFQTWFYIIIGSVPFIFFREKLSLSIYKVFFQYSIFIIFILSIFDKFFKIILNKEDISSK